MKKVVGFSLILTSLFAADYQVGAGVGAGNGYKFMDVRMEKYLTPQNTIRFEMERTTKTKNSITTKAEVGISQDLQIKTDDIKTYAFANAGYQTKSGDKNGVVADIGVGAAYKIDKKTEAFMEFKTSRDFANKETNYEAVAGVSYKFISSEDKDLQYSSAIPAKDIIKEKKEIKTLAKVEKPKAVKKEIVEDKTAFDEFDTIAVDKESNINNYENNYNNKIVISQNDSNSINNKEKFKFVMHYSRKHRYIKEEDMQHLIDFAEYLQAHPNVKAEIQGFTDNKGTFSENKKLAERKAKLVYNILLDLGVSESQLSYKGYGEADSINSKTQQANMVVAKLQA